MHRRILASSGVGNISLVCKLVNCNGNWLCLSFGDKTSGAEGLHFSSTGGTGGSQQARVEEDKLFVRGQTNSIKYLQCNCLPGFKYTSVEWNPSNAESCQFTSDSLCKTSHPGAMERDSGHCQRPQLLTLPTAALLLLQQPILLSSTTSLV